MVAGSPSPSLHLARTGVLVLGAGLAGLRAAMAAREADPACPVLLATAHAGPSGSSFANRNNALGIQAPENHAQAEALTMRALELAGPGLVEPRLAGLVAEESPARLSDLLAWGLTFDAGASGLTRRTGCFLPEHKSAVVLRDLGRAFALLSARLTGLGATLTGGLGVLGLIAAPEPGRRVLGALLRDQGGGLLAMRARAVVLALGGPAGLFARAVSGPGVPGHGPALLARAGARLENMGFLQFLWHDLKTGCFTPVHDLAQPGAGLASRASGGSPAPLDPDLAALCPSRALHCPVANGLADNRLDHFLMQRLGWGRNGEPRGVALVLRAGTEPVCAAPLAHAGNGGALIDEHGRTTVPGLYACGECATGMHGADRVGGAMVAATQVFGCRAGGAAVLEAASEVGDALHDREFADLARAEAEGADGPRLDPIEAQDLRRLLWRGFLPCGAGLKGFGERLAALLRTGRQREDALFLESCRILAAARQEPQGSAPR